MSKLRLLAFALLGLLALGGCGSTTPSAGSASPTTAASPTKPATPTPPPLVDLTNMNQVTIHLVDSSVTSSGFGYDLPSIKIKVGTTVTWINTSNAPHTVTSGTPGAPDGKFDSGLQNLLLSGNQGAASMFHFTFGKPGIFPYFCQLHPSMMAQIIVVS